MMPKKERLPSPREAWTKLLNNPLLSASKQHAGLKVCFFARPVSSWLVYICEYCAEASDRCRNSPTCTGYEEQSLGDIAANWGEQAQSLKVLKMSSSPDY